MSTVAETARREAEEAERDDEANEAAIAEGETPAEPEPDDPTPEPEPPAEPVDLEKRNKALSGEATRHENALKKAYGDDFERRAFCPCCLGEGFLEPWAAGAMPDEVWEAVKALSGKLESGEYEHPAELVTCDRCQGFGQVATGARNEHTAVIPCALCESRGYFDMTNPVHRAKLGLPAPQSEVPQVVFPTYHAPEPVNGTAEKLMPPDGWHAAGSPGADTWGRWPGHPRFGIDPANGGY